MPVRGRDLERIRFWKGQRLRSGDFRTEIATAEQLGQWHNRALHNSFGVVEGLTVELQGEKIVVGAGSAYDCDGRILFLPKKKIVPIPANLKISQTAWVLVLYYEQLSGSCKVSSESCSQDFGVRLCWMQASRFQVKYGIPLAELKIGEENQRFVLSTVQSKARAFRRPHISFGTTIPGSGWELWELEIGERRVGVGLQVRIDTSSAGFTQTPSYFAWFNRLPSLSKEVTALQRNSLMYAQLSPRLEEVTLNGFILRLLIPPFGKISGSVLNLIQESRLSIIWIGFQQGTGQPPVDFRRTHHGNH